MTAVHHCNCNAPHLLERFFYGQVSRHPRPLCQVNNLLDDHYMKETYCEYFQYPTLNGSSVTPLSTFHTVTFNYMDLKRCGIRKTSTGDLQSKFY